MNRRLSYNICNLYEFPIKFKSPLKHIDLLKVTYHGMSKSLSYKRNIELSGSIGIPSLGSLVRLLSSLAV